MLSPVVGALLSLSIFQPLVQAVHDASSTASSLAGRLEKPMVE